MLRRNLGVRWSAGTRAAWKGCSGGITLLCLVTAANAGQLRPCTALSLSCCAQADAAVTKADAKAPPADIRRYLKATGLIELRYIRKLSSLCAQTYFIRKLTVRLCWRTYFCENALLTSAF